MRAAIRGNHAKKMVDLIQNDDLAGILNDLQRIRSPRHSWHAGRQAMLSQIAAPGVHCHPVLFRAGRRRNGSRRTNIETADINPGKVGMAIRRARDRLVRERVGLRAHRLVRWGGAHYGHRERPPVSAAAPNRLERVHGGCRGRHRSAGARRHNADPRLHFDAIRVYDHPRQLHTLPRLNRAWLRRETQNLRRGTKRESARRRRRRILREARAAKCRGGEYQQRRHARDASKSFTHVEYPDGRPLLMRPSYFLVAEAATWRRPLPSSSGIIYLLAVW